MTNIPETWRERYLLLIDVAGADEACRWLRMGVNPGDALLIRGTAFGLRIAAANKRNLTLPAAASVCNLTADEYGKLAKRGQAPRPTVGMIGTATVDAGELAGWVAQFGSVSAAASVPASKSIRGRVLAL